MMALVWLEWGGGDGHCLFFGSGADGYVAARGWKTVEILTAWGERKVWCCYREDGA